MHDVDGVADVKRLEYQPLPLVAGGVIMSKIIMDYKGLLGYIRNDYSSIADRTRRVKVKSHVDRCCQEVSGGVFSHHGAK